MKTLEELIAAYRAELDDTAEIEDHLRLLVDELRAAGIAEPEALDEARLRVGEPRALARELALVRSPFGARPSRARAWSAVALLAPTLIFFAWTTRLTTSSLVWIDVGLITIAVCALALRHAWARAVLLGVLPANLAWVAIVALAWQPTALTAFHLVAFAGAFAFLVPWRRGELGSRGVALVLASIAFEGASAGLGGYPLIPRALPLVAVAAVFVGGLGILVRARWAAIPFVASATILAATTLDLLRVPYDLAPFRWISVGNHLAALIASAIAAPIAWRAARSRVGTLRGVISL